MIVRVSVIVALATLTECLQVRTVRTVRRSTAPCMGIPTTSALAARELSDKYKAIGDKYKSTDIDLSSFYSTDSPPASRQPEVVAPEAPKAEPTKVDMPEMQPKAEPPETPMKVEAAQADPPEVPKVELPEMPKMEVPKVEVPEDGPGLASQFGFPDETPSGLKGADGLQLPDTSSFELPDLSGLQLPDLSALDSAALQAKLSAAVDAATAALGSLSGGADATALQAQLGQRGAELAKAVQAQLGGSGEALAGALGPAAAPLTDALEAARAAAAQLQLAEGGEITPEVGAKVVVVAFYALALAIGLQLLPLLLTALRLVLNVGIALAVGVALINGYALFDSIPPPLQPVALGTTAALAALAAGAFGVRKAQVAVEDATTKVREGVSAKVEAGPLGSAFRAASERQEQLSSALTPVAEAAAPLLEVAGKAAGAAAEAAKAAAQAAAKAREEEAQAAAEKEVQEAQAAAAEKLASPARKKADP